MFYLFRKLRSAIKALRSEVSPHELAMGAFLGILAGLPPLGRHLILPLLLVFLLRNTVGFTLLFFAIGRGLGLLLAQPAFDLGVRLLRDSNTFDGIMAWVTQAPVLGLLGLNRYYVFGSFALALPLALVAYVVMRIAVYGFRQKLAVWTASRPLHEKMANKWWFRLGSWLLLGGKAKPKERKAVALPWRYLRKSMVIGTPILLVLFTVGGVLAVEYGLGSAVVYGVERSTGARTTVGASFAQPFTQRVGLSQLVVEDPLPGEAEPMLTVDAMHLDLDTLALLSGRLRIPEARISGFTLRLVRDERGAVNVTTTPAVTGREGGEGAPGASEEEDAYWDWVNEKAADVDWLELASKTIDFVQKRMAAQERARAERTSLPFDPYAAEDYALLEPFVRIDRLALENCRIEIVDRRPGKKSPPPLVLTEASLANLSSNRALRDETVVAKVDAGFGTEGLGRVRLDGGLAPPGQGSRDGDLTVDTRIQDLDVTAFASLFETTLPLDLESGVIDFASNLVIGDGAFKGSIGTVLLKGLALLERPGTTLLGLDPEASHWFVRAFNAVSQSEDMLKLHTIIEGPVDQPRLNWDAELLAIGKRGLEKLALELGEEEARRLMGVFQHRIADELEALGGLGKTLGPEVSALFEQDVLGPLVQGNPEALADLARRGKLQELPAKIGGQALESLVPEDVASPLRDLTGGRVPIPGLGDPNKEPGKEGAIPDLLRGSGLIPGSGTSGSKEKDPAKKDPLEDPAGAASDLLRGSGLFGGRKEPEKEKPKEGERKKRDPEKDPGRR